MLKKMKVLVGVLAFIFNLASLATAESSTPSKEEIAKELANPNTVLTSLKLQTQYFSFDGDLRAQTIKTWSSCSSSPHFPSLWKMEKPFGFVPGCRTSSTSRSTIKTVGAWAPRAVLGISPWTCNMAQRSRMASSGASDSHRSFQQLRKKGWAARCGPWGPAFSSAALPRNLFSVYSPTTSGTLRATASRVQTSRISAGAMLRST